MDSERFAYRNNKKAWMTTEMFAEWLKSFDRRMEALGKHNVILLLDNFAGHKASKRKDLPVLRRTKILYHPANTTSKSQPLDAGIIRNFKLYYHKRFNRCILQRLEMIEDGAVRGAMNLAIGLLRSAPLMVKSDKPAYNLRYAIDLAVDAWKDVTPQTLANCFRHCNIRTDTANLHEPMSAITIDQEAVKDIESTHNILFQKQPELIEDHIDVQSLMSNAEENEIGFESDNRMTVAQLLAESVDYDDIPLQDDSDVLPKVTKKEATKALLTLNIFFQQQNATDLASEQAMIRKRLDYVEARRFAELEQSSIRSFFIPQSNCIHGFTIHPLFW